nr:DMT family transporter [Cognatiyoonia koreensis]
MLLFSALVAGSFALGELAANEIAPAALNAVRFWIAAMVVGFVALSTTGLPRTVAHSLWRYPVLAFFFIVYFVLMFEGLKTAPAVSAAAVFTLTPILSALFGWLLLRQRFTGRIALALAIGGAGALWVIFRANLGALMSFDIGRGEVIYFVGCVSHAIYTPLVATLNRGEPAVAFTFGTLIAGALMLTAWAWGDLMATDWANLPAIVWITILYTAVFASAATFTLLQFAALQLPSSKVMAYTYLTPTWVIVWTIAMGQQAPPLILLVGVAMTVLALLLLLKNEDRDYVRGASSS